MGLWEIDGKPNLFVFMFIYCYVWILQGFYGLHEVEICLKQVSRVWNKCFLKQVSWVSCHEFEVSLKISFKYACKYLLIEDLYFQVGI